MEIDEELFAKLSQEQMARWFVKSIQAMLNTDDDHLKGLGGFIDRSMANLILAFLANGAKEVILDGEKVQEDQLIKVLTNRLVNKLRTHKALDPLSEQQLAEAVQDQKWKKFIHELPLPLLLQELLINQSTELQKTILESEGVTNSIDLYTNIDVLYKEAEKKVLDYEQGYKLVSIVEKVTDLIIEQLFEKRDKLFSTFGLGDSLEELLSQYLPGVKVDNKLNDWFKKNVKGLKESEKGTEAELVTELKKQVKAVILKALDNTIGATITQNENYAAQLLPKIHEAFIQSISGFDSDDAKRKEIEEAYELQSKIQAKKEEIEKLREKMNDRPKGLNDEQRNLLDDVFETNIRLIKAEQYTKSLNERLDQTISALNEKIKPAKWSKEELSSISKAIDLHRMLVAEFKSKADFISSLEQKTKADYIASLEQKIIDLQQAENHEDVEAAAQEEIKSVTVLLNLLKMNSEESQLISDALNIQATISRAEDAGAKLKDELAIKHIKVDAYKHNYKMSHQHQELPNKKEWKTAVEWMEETLAGREKLYQLIKQITELHQKLDARLGIFQVLSVELTKLLGLDQKKELKLPSLIENQVWSLIETAKKEHIARLLFKQLAPMYLTRSDIPKNTKRLLELSNHDPFLIMLASNVSKEVVNHLSHYITNYRPFAELILLSVGALNETAKDKELTNEEMKEKEEATSRMEGALRRVMIDVGKEGVTPSLLIPLLKGNVPSDMEADLSKLLSQWIAEEEELELSQEQMLIKLKTVMPSNSQKEEEALKITKQKLTHLLNEFLINRGKGILKPDNLIEAYQKILEEDQKKPLTDAESKSATDKLIAEKVVEQIKAVIITPEEIAHALNDIIPGAEDLHHLIAPELKQVIIGGNDKELKALKENHEYIQRYIEGFLLQFFVRIAEANLEDR